MASVKRNRGAQGSGAGSKRTRPKTARIVKSFLTHRITSFETALAIVRLSERGNTGSEIAAKTGRSTSYVSKKLTTYGRACPELRQAWERGDLRDNVVYEIATLPVEKQRARLLSPAPAKPVTSRPSSEVVTDMLIAIEHKLNLQEKRDPMDPEENYAAGVRDALLWVIGKRATDDFVKLTHEVTS